MDTYSNILYVKEHFAALSHLAHRVSAADKYRPETCCIIGNYYSLKGQHEKASIVQDSLMSIPIHAHLYRVSSGSERLHVHLVGCLRGLSPC